MKLNFSILAILMLFHLSHAQLIESDNPSDPQSTYTPEQLIENVFIAGGCAKISNVSSESFQASYDATRKSYGYFKKGPATDFPFEEGIILSTGYSKSVSDTGASPTGEYLGTPGDTDLENALGLDKTFDATSIRFTFTPTTPTISFRYIMASHEYKSEYYTCGYTDGFAFLLRPSSGGPYQNIAVLPNGDTVSVNNINTTDKCGKNQSYYHTGITNTTMEGRTIPLTAVANVTPGVEYEIKIVVSDQKDTIYNAAIFLEAGSFDIGSELQDASICGNETATLDTGYSSATHTWYKDGVVIPGETGSTLTVSEPDTYSVSIAYSGSCTITSEATVSSTPSTEDATFSLTATCTGATATVTGDSGGTFAFNPVPSDGATINSSTGEISNGISNTSYTVEYTTSGSCPNSSTNSVTVLDDEDASFTLTAVCGGAEATITGDTGGTFAFNPLPSDGATIDSSTGEITNGITSTTYTVEYTTGGSCPATTSENVTVLRNADPSFTLTATCDGATANILGDTGGVFSLDPVPTDGAVINATTGTITNGTHGTTYTVRYGSIPGCPPGSSTQTVTTLDSDDASFTMTASCSGATATITGDTGGTFAFDTAPTDGATIDVNTGEISNGSPGTTYTTTYTTNGTCPDSSSQNVTILNSQDASFTMTANCSGGTATITGDTGGTFAFNPAPGDSATINSTTGEITNGNSNTTYTVEYTTGGTCPASTTQNVTVLTTEDTSFSLTANCSGGIATITGDTGGTFTFNPAPGDGATINSSTGEITNGSSNTTYTVEYTITGACPSTTTQSITTLTTDNANFTMTAGCSGATASISGTTGGTFAFNPIPSDGALLNSSTGEITNGINNTTYTVEYTTPGTCSASSNQNVTILTEQDASFELTAECLGATASITGTPGGTFTEISTGNSGSVNPSTGEISLALPFETYTIEYTTPGPCSTSSTESVTIPAGDDASFTMNPTCGGAQATITGTTGGTFSFNVLPIDGATIDPTTGEITNGVNGNTYSVMYLIGGLCPNSSVESVTLPINTSPSFTLTPACNGATATITGTPGGTFIFNPLPGDGATIDAATGEITNGTSGATYSIQYDSPPACPGTSTESVTLTVSDDASFTLTPNCNGATATITGTTGGTFSFNPLPGDGAVIDASTGEITNATNNTTYTIEYTTTGTCSDTQSVSTTTLTDDDASFNLTATCSGATATITGDTGGTFAFNPVPGDGASINASTGEITNGVSGTSYSIDYTTGGTCPQTANQNVTILSTEDASFSLSANCNGATATITGDSGGTFSFSPIPTDGATINASTGEITNGVSNTSYTVEYTTAGTCAVTATETVTVLASDDASFTMIPNCSGATANITGDTGGTFAFNPAPGDGATIDASTGTISNGLSTNTYTVEYTTSGTCSATTSQSVTPLILSNPTFIAQPNCSGATAIITGDLGGVFSFNPAPTDGATVDASTGTVTNATSGTTYTLQYSTPVGCPPGATTQNFTVLTTDDASFTLIPNCSGATATIQGVTGGTFSFNPVPTDGATIDASTGEITNGVNGSSYTVDYETTGACSASSSETITLPPLDDSSFSMTPNCGGATASILGDDAGLFTFNPTPTDGAVIDSNTGTITNAINGETYGVEYTTSGICPTSTIVNVTIDYNFNTNFTLTATCDGATATVTGETGGTFSLNPIPADGATIDAQTGEITNGISGATYTIEYSSPLGCNPGSSFRNVTVLSPLTPLFTMTTNCNGAIATITGDTGGTFAFNPLPWDNATIDPVTGTITNAETYRTYSVEYTLGGACPSSYTELIKIEPSIELRQPESLVLCDINNTGDGVEAFNLEAVITEVLDGQSNIDITFHESSEGIVDENNSIQNINDFLNDPTQAPHTIWVKGVDKTNGCVNFTHFTITVEAPPTIPVPTTLNECDDDDDGFTTFNLENLRATILSNLGTPATISFHKSEDDARSNTAPITALTSYTNTVKDEETLFVRTELATYDCYATNMITLIVNPLPILNLEDSYTICDDQNGTYTNFNTILDTELSESDYSFEWTLQGDSAIISTSSSIEPSAIGNYTVTATNILTGCQNSQTVEVIPSWSPGLNAEVTTEDFADEHTIVATVTGNNTNSIYEFSLNDGPWMSNSENPKAYTFNNVRPGIYEVRVRDINGCGDNKVVVYALGYPPYFTPNNDGYHDTWNIYAIDMHPEAIIHIFDRYGKLLKHMSPLGKGWDGKLRGAALPATDYWFTLEYKDRKTKELKIHRGHFSLKR